jgi:quinol monooxygenase YgiN
MIVVIGTAKVKPGDLDTVLKESLEHVARSRAEDGCIAHTVARDQEDSNLLRFVEYWRDEAALLAHFAVPASREFIATVTPHLTAPPEMEIFDADKIKLT